MSQKVSENLKLFIGFRHRFGRIPRRDSLPRMIKHQCQVPDDGQWSSEIPSTQLDNCHWGTHVTDLMWNNALARTPIACYVQRITLRAVFNHEKNTSLPLTQRYLFAFHIFLFFFHSRSIMLDTLAAKRALSPKPDSRENLCSDIDDLIAVKLAHETLEHLECKPVDSSSKIYGLLFTLWKALERSRINLQHVKSRSRVRARWPVEWRIRSTRKDSLVRTREAYELEALTETSQRCIAS